MTAGVPPTPSIVSTLRTAFAPVHGALAEHHPVDLLAGILGEIRSATVGEDPLVFCGVTEPVGAQAGNVADAAMASAGWPCDQPAVILSGGELCGQTALNAAIDAVIAGRTELALATSVSSASIVPPGASMRSRDFGRAWAELSAPPSPSQACEQRAASRALARVDLHEWTDRMRTQDHSPTAPTWIHSVSLPSGAATPSSDQAPAPPGDEFAMFDDDGVITATSWARISDGAAVVAIQRDHDGPAAAVVQRCAWRSRLPSSSEIAELTDDIGWSTLDSQCSVLDLEVVEVLELDPDTVNLRGSALLRGRPLGVSNLASTIDAHRLAVETSTPGLVVCAGVDGSIEATRIEPVQ